MNTTTLNQEQTLTIANLCGAAYAAKVNPLQAIRKTWGIPTFYNTPGSGRVFVSVTSDGSGRIHGIVSGDSNSSTLLEAGFEVNQERGTFTVSKNW